MLKNDQTQGKKILIVDEERCRRVCAAILELVGIESARVVSLNRFDSDQSLEDYEFVITSFPYDQCLLDRLLEQNLPAMVFSDCLSGELLEKISNSSNMGCMIKPIDFEKFKEMLSKYLQSSNSFRGGQIV